MFLNVFLLAGHKPETFFDGRGLTCAISKLSLINSLKKSDLSEDREREAR